MKGGVNYVKTLFVIHCISINICLVLYKINVQIDKEIIVCSVNNSGCNIIIKINKDIDRKESHYDA